MKKRLWISTVCLFILLVVGCSSNNLNDENEKEDNQAENNQSDNKSESNRKLGDYQVELSGMIIEEEDKFIVEAESNLLPGSILIGDIIVDDGKTVISDATTKVEEDGSFQMELDHHIYGDANLIIGFYFESSKDQEDEIFDHYGETGENLEGSFVYRYSNKDRKRQK